MDRIDPTTGPRYSATASTTPAKEEVKDAPSRADVAAGWIFPFEPLWIFGHFFPSLYRNIPSQWRVIQSLPHLVLLTGTLTNVCLLVRIIEDAYHWRHRPIPYMVVMTGSGVFSVFCFWQLFKELVQYRHDLQTRAAQVENLKAALATQFEDSASELEELLARSTNTEAGLAERNLDSERRDFQRILKNISPKLSKSLTPLPAVEEAFRRFLQIWLVVLAECSADPVGRPYTVIGESELLSLGAAELSERLSQYLKANEIRFIKDNVEEGKKDILKIKNGWKTMVAMQRKAMKLAGLSRFAKKTCPDEEQGKQDDKAEVLEMPAIQEREKIDAFWFRFQLGSGCGVEVDEEEHFPIRFRCMLFLFIILSPEHLSLLLSFILSLFFITANVFLSDPSQVIIASLGVSSLCMAFVLYDFLDIDSVQRLEQQIAEMKATTQQVEKRRRDLQVFFARVHLLMSLWQMRTLPRLEMLKQLGIMMEDEELSDLLLSETVEKLSAFERTMLPLPFWQEEGALSPTQKYDSLQLLQPLSTLPGKELLKQMPETTVKLRQLANGILDAREAPETG